jgi:hypothetical protein
MVRTTPSLLLIAASLALAPALGAAEATPPPATGTPLPAILARPPSGGQKVEAQAPARPRAISPEVAAMLKTNMPKFAPPPPKPETAEKTDDAQSQYENEKPQNGIVRLPKMVVREPRPVIFTERAIYTKKGLAELAFKRYISEADRALNRFTLPLFGISAEARALQMYAEDERLRNMADMKDAARIVSLTDTDGGLYLKKAAEQTYMRTNDFGWNNGKSSR